MIRITGVNVIIPFDMISSQRVRCPYCKRGWMSLDVGSKCKRCGSIFSRDNVYGSVVVKNLSDPKPSKISVFCVAKYHHDCKNCECFCHDVKYTHKQCSKCGGSGLIPVKEGISLKNKESTKKYGKKKNRTSRGG